MILNLFLICWARDQQQKYRQENSKGIPKLKSDAIRGWKTGGWRSQKTTRKRIGQVCNFKTKLFKNSENKKYLISE